MFATRETRKKGIPKVAMTASKGIPKFTFNTVSLIEQLLYK